MARTTERHTLFAPRADAAVRNRTIAQGKFFLISCPCVDPNASQMRCMLREPVVPVRIVRTRFGLRFAPASDNAQHAAGTSQDDGTPAENPSDTSMATVHLGPRPWRG